MPRIVLKSENNLLLGRTSMHSALSWRDGAINVDLARRVKFTVITGTGGQKRAVEQRRSTLNCLARPSAFST